jgi:prepilin-type processing-associated H-X9-DG protein
MKTKFSERRNEAFTLIDLLVIVAVLAILAAMILPMRDTGSRHAQRINCVINLKQVGLAFHMWADDYNNQYPMSYPTNGVSEWPVTTNIAVYFQAMSNELNTPKILICPADQQHNMAATNWMTDFNNSHISYYFNLDARRTYPQELLSGDDNFTINGTPAKPGLILLSTNTTISWTAERHVKVGNLSFADGSVAEESSAGFQNALILATNGTPFTTSRIVIP